MTKDIRVIFTLIANFTCVFLYSRNASYSANTLADTKADCRSASSRLTTSTYSANSGSTTATATTAAAATATHRSTSTSTAGIVFLIVRSGRQD